MTGNKKTITYRTYLYPGILFDEESTKEVEYRDVKESKKGAPKGAFAFEFYERTKIVEDGETLWGPEKNRSHRFYLGGATYTLAQVQKRFPNERILISNMRGNGYAKVIKTRAGNFQPFDGKKARVLTDV